MRIVQNVDPDQRRRSGETDLGLHCLPVFTLWDARHKCIKLKVRMIGSIKLRQLFR